MISVEATYVGTATVLYTLRHGPQTLTVLTDPVFGGPGLSHAIFGLNGLRYTSLGTPSLRPEQLPPIDVVLLSHDGHVDNFDPAGREVARRARLVVTTPGAARRLARGGLSHAHGLAPWDTLPIGPAEIRIRVTATPARHGPPLSGPVVGSVSGFLLEWPTAVVEPGRHGRPFGPLWISGDTVWHRALRPLAERRIGVAVVHAGAASLSLTAGLRYTMGARGLVRMARTLKPELICPVHYDGWSHFRQGRGQIAAALDRAGLAPRCLWLPRGTAVSLAGHVSRG